MSTAIPGSVLDISRTSLLKILEPRPGHTNFPVFCTFILDNITHTCGIGGSG